MLAAVDSDFLSLLLNPASSPPDDPETGKPVERVIERIEYLVAELERQKTRLIVPTPALSEFLVIADESGPDYVSLMDGHAVLKVEPFDQKAAIEAAASSRKALADGDKKSGAEKPWQCVKTDRQIVAVARTLGITTIYSNDKDMRNIAAKCGIAVIHVADLPIPPEQQQGLFSEEVPDDPLTFSAAIERAPLSEQSLDVVRQKASQHEPAPPLGLPADPEPQPPDSSPTDPRRPQSKK